MRLSISVNNRPPVTGSLTAAGWLSAHLNLRHDGSDEQSNRASIVAMNTSEAPNTVHSHWEAGPLAVGDNIEVKILPDGESDPPTDVRRTSGSPQNLFSDVEQARMLLAAIKSCDQVLMEVLRRASAVEPPDELKKIELAIASVSVEFDRKLISPMIRRHPELLAEAEALELL